MKSFSKIFGIFGILMMVAAAVPSDAFACASETDNSSNPIPSPSSGASGGTGSGGAGGAGG